MQDISRVPQPLGPRIRIAREQAGLTTEELAERLGVEAASVEAWEADARAPRANRLTMLAGVLNVSLMWLLEGRQSEYMESYGQAPSVEGLRAHLVGLRGTLEHLQRQLDDAEAALDACVEEDSQHPANGS